MIQEATSDTDIEKCFSVLLELRPHLIREDFVARIRKQMDEGYRLVYISEDAEIKAVMGFRFMKSLSWGSVLYIDDLITGIASRGKGFGSKMLDYSREQATIKGCNEIHLDSGYQRNDAHRLYLNKGFKLSCHHFSLQL
mmetsp:Transcript_14488/g.21628  ORF Transcript_14488/g.21628 Transcript_14488/m.21628 type:complete len:139 (+) Transcript_14488:1-417(+)